jgi:hypothetical protein
VSEEFDPMSDINAASPPGSGMNHHVSTLSAEQVASFARDGFLVIRQFYDLDADIRPIQLGIHQVIGLLLAKYHVAFVHPPFQPDTFDAGYQALIAADRRYGGDVYDAIKQIPAFMRWVSMAPHEALFRQLRQTTAAGVAAGGYGIRIDNPGENRFRAEWHQEYPAQLRSLDGLVYWSSLIPLTPELGLVRVHTHDPADATKTGAYGLILEDQAARIARYAQVAPLLQPGDLVMMDFLTLHASGHNVGARPRWSMQMRYFNFADPTGVRIGWQGSYAAGKDFRQIHPELVVD